MSIRVTLNCAVNPGQHKALMSFVEKNLPNVRNFDGCRIVNVYFDKINDEMLLEEEWDNTTQHHNYINHIQNNGILNELASYFQSPPIIKYFEKVPI